MADIKDWKRLSAPDEEWEATMAKLPARPNLAAFQEISHLRAYMADSRRKALHAFPTIDGVVSEDHQVSMRDGAKITVRVYKPEGKEECPLVVVYHGGGWCIGGLENEEYLCKRLAGILGCVSVNVDYRLAPEHQFPVAHNDCYDATKWVISQAAVLGAAPSKGFVIAGTSAGGNMAAVIALQLRDEKSSPHVTGCHLMIPALCHVESMPEKYQSDYHSWEQNKDADLLGRGAADLFFRNYLPNAKDHKSELFNPLIWPTGFRDFPKTYLQICGADPLRDEALIFERVLRTEQGTKTKVDMYPGLPHGFWGAFPALKSSGKFRDDSVEGVRWLLSEK